MNTTKSHKCDIGNCVKSFSSAHALGSHKRLAHDIRGTSRSHGTAQERAIATATTITTPASAFTCKLCPNEPTFRTGNHLGQHYRHAHGGAVSAHQQLAAKFGVSKWMAQRKLNGAIPAELQAAIPRAHAVTLEEAIQTLEAEIHARQEVIERLRILDRQMQTL